MIIKVYRAKQYSDTVNGGWADYTYSFEPIQAVESDGCGGGVYGHCVIDEATEPWREYEVPDGSELVRWEDGNLYLVMLFCREAKPLQTAR